MAAHLVHDEELWQFGTREQGTAVVRAPGVRCHHSDSHGEEAPWLEIQAAPSAALSIDENRGVPQ